MHYLTQIDEIERAIATYSQCQILWLDTEIADFQTNKPRLSLIQVLDDSNDLHGESVLILDVLEKPKLVEEFIEKIMKNSAIEKVFHNANYDLQFLGKRLAKNVTCTLEMVKKIPYYLVPLPNRKLKTLAEQICKFSFIDKTEQTGDWSKRPLTQEQLNYATMDAVYLACIHNKLLQITRQIQTIPEEEDISALTIRYRQIEPRWKQLDTEIAHLKERLKAAMKCQNVCQKSGFHLSTQKRRTKKVSLTELAKLLEANQIELDLSIPLDKTLEKKLGGLIEELSVEEETKTIWQLRVTEMDDEDLPF
jgi:ribonuclease D